MKLKPYDATINHQVYAARAAGYFIGMHRLRELAQAGNSCYLACLSKHALRLLTCLCSDSQSTPTAKIKVMGGSRAGGASGDGALVLDPNIGRRVSVMYPSHGGWYGGIITDYNGLTKEHWCAHRENHLLRGYFPA